MLLLLYNFKDLHLYLHVTFFTAAELPFSLSMAKQSRVFDKFKVPESLPDVNLKL